MYLQCSSLPSHFLLPSHSSPLSLPSHFPLIPLHLPSHFVSHPSHTPLPTLSIPLTSPSLLSFPSHPPLTPPFLILSLDLFSLWKKRNYPCSLCCRIIFTHYFYWILHTDISICIAVGKLWPTCSRESWWWCMYTFLADQSPESILGSASFSCDMMLLLRHFSLEVAVKPGMWWQHCDARCKKRLCFPTNEVGCWGLHVNWILVEMYILVKAHIDHRGETVHWILVLERAWLPGELSRFLFAFFCFSLWRISLGEDLYFCNEIS